jgi:hypothetical protein
VIPEKNFSRVLLKVNTAGSWANVVSYDVARYDEVKAAAEVLAKANGRSIRFKILDADGGVIEQYGPTKPNGLICWHEP